MFFHNNRIIEHFIDQMSCIITIICQMLMILTSFSLKDQEIVYRIPIYTFDKCFYMEEMYKIICTDSNHRLLEMNLLEDEISLAQSYQFSYDQFLLSQKFFYSRDLTQVLFISQTDLRVFKLQDGAFTLQWQFLGSEPIEYVRVLCDFDGILFSYFGSNPILISNLQDQSQTFMEANALIRGDNDIYIDNHAMSSDNFFYSFQNTSNSVKIYHLQYSQGRVTFTEEATIPTTVFLDKDKSSFSEHGEYFIFYDNAKIHIYERDPLTNSYTFTQQIQWVHYILRIQMNGRTLSILSYNNGNFVYYLKIVTGNQFQIIDSQSLNVNNVRGMGLRENYTFIYTTMDIHLSYSCSEDCQTCNAHRSCSQCTDNLKVQKGGCRGYDECFDYFDSSFSVCKKFCDKECEKCGDSPDQCLQCSEKSVLSEGSCSEKSSSILAGTLYTLSYAIRFPNLRSIYVLIDNIELYQYHRIVYDGKFAEVLQEVHQINKMVEDFLMSNQIEESTKMCGLSQYNYFTNPSYLKVERKNQLFLVNFVVSDAAQMLLRVLCFFILHFTFRALFNYPISRYLRIYSFKLYLLELIFCHNIAGFSYMFIENCRMLFKLSHTWIEVGALCFGIIFSATAVIAAPCLFYVYKIAYGKLRKYFFTNLFRRPGATQYSILRYLLKPVFLGLTHSIFFDDQRCQMMIMVGIEIWSFLMTMIFSLKFDIFKVKTIMVISLNYDLLVFFLNFLQLLKIGSYGEQVNTFLEIGVKVCIYGLVAGVFIQIIVSILDHLLAQRQFMSRTGIKRRRIIINAVSGKGNIEIQGKEQLQNDGIGQEVEGMFCLTMNERNEMRLEKSIVENKRGENLQRQKI